MDSELRARELLLRIEAWGHARRWLGSDPYEGLNAERLVGPLTRRPRAQRLVIQAVKRSPVDLRPVLGIPPGQSSAALASVVSAYALGGFLPAAETRRRLDAVVAVLMSLRRPQYEEPCWGYHFAFRSRLLYYDRTTPNTIATVFAGVALLDAHRSTEDPALLELARGTGRFFLRHVPQTPDGDGAFFGYVPGDRAPVHNSSMLVAAFLARLAASGGGDAPEFRSAASAALRWTVARQRPDGSWPYGERRDLTWVDNFHTGYVLDALRVCADAGLPDAAEAWARGLRFYREALFQDDGAPKYTATSLYPIDAQCVAQGIQTLATAAAHVPACAPQAWKVFEFATAHMLRRDGMPLFQRGRFWTNGALHVRWVAAPVMLALAHLIRLRPASRDATTERPRALSGIEPEAAA